MTLQNETEPYDGVIGFIGAGMMAEAVVKGILNAQLTVAEKIWVFDMYEERRIVLANMGCSVARDNSEVIRKSDVIVVAVKPHQVQEVLQSNQKFMRDGKLVISLAAGITLSSLQSYLPVSRVARVMPNSPCLVGESATAYTLGKFSTEKDGKVVNMIFNAVGQVVEVPENLMDAVTGLSGSGPAYVLLFIESLIDGGVRMGLPRPMAKVLAMQTVYGAAKMALENPDVHIAELRNRVESPGGTTTAGVHALELGNVRCDVSNAVAAATNRCIELGAQHTWGTK